MKTLEVFKLIGIFFLALSILASGHSFSHAFAQETDIAGLSKQIMESKDKGELFSLFEGLKDLYFKENKYNDFVDYLASLSRKKRNLRAYVYYYTALSRFYQLKYLEETQKWNEYFENKDLYQEQLLVSAQDAVESTRSEDSLHIYSKLLLCRYYHGLWEDDLTEGCIFELVESAEKYSKDATDLIPLKDVADQLMSDGNKTEAKRLYGLFAEGLEKSGVSDAGMLEMADQFFQEQQLDLAETVYELYLSKIRPAGDKDTLITALKEIGEKFAYKDLGPSQPLYAEKIFSELQEVAGIKAFGQQFLYLRAFNLEKMHEYPKGREIYADLVELYPEDKHVDEANFKIGVIDTYVLGNIKNGELLFGKLSSKLEPNPWVAASAYQLGLLSQWRDNLDQAKGFYDQVTKISTDDTLTLAQERLRELDQKIPMEYNLKTFLDLSLKKDTSKISSIEGQPRTISTGQLQGELVNLRALPPKKEIGGELDVESRVQAPESGCTQVELSYLWSGYLGETDPAETDPSFFTEYKHRGSKVINLVVVNPSGIVDYGIEIVDIY